MQRAINLASDQLGKTAPNPTVGCVIVENGRVISEAVTGIGGNPHAEQKALEQVAGKNLSRAAVYVTLEPCCSRSSGAPGCSDRLINSGVERVVIAQEDPHPTANGGITKLNEAGMIVSVGILEQEAAFLTEGFFRLLRTGKPLLEISRDNIGYDAELHLLGGETPEQALLRYGKEGKTRLFVRAGSKLANDCKLAGLIGD